MISESNKLKYCRKQQTFDTDLFIMYIHVMTCSRGYQPKVRHDEVGVGQGTEDGLQLG